MTGRHHVFQFFAFGCWVVVRFDLTLDGTLNVTATQAATGVSEELTIDNALSQFQADERSHAKARLHRLFEDSPDILGDADVPVESVSTSAAGASESQFSEAIDLLKQAEKLRSSVEGDDAEDLDSLVENLQQAIAVGDTGAVSSLAAELDDILFYVR